MSGATIDRAYQVIFEPLEHRFTSIIYSLAYNYLSDEIYLRRSPPMRAVRYLF